MDDLTPMGLDADDLFMWSIRENHEEIARLPFAIDPMVGDVIEIVIDGKVKQLMVVARRMRATILAEDLRTDLALDVKRVAGV